MDFEDEIDSFTDTEIDTPSKFDSVWLGLIVGIIAPLLSFVMFYYSSFSKVPIGFFIDYSLKIGAFINIITVCLIPNFLIFSLFMWRKHYLSAKGIVIASAAITVLLIAIKFALLYYMK